MTLLRQNFAAWIACLIVFLAGIVASFSLGSRLETDAYRHWFDLARSEANKVTEITLFELSQVTVAMHAIEAEFTNSETLSDERLLEILFDVEGWNLHISPVVLAYAERVSRNNRESYEAVHGTVTSVLEPSVRAPEEYESFVITYSSDTDRVLRLNMDMVTFPKMKSVVATASRMPDQMIMGPAFHWDDGDTYSVVGLNSEQDDLDGIILGLINLDELYAGLENVYLPDGMVLRVSEREGDDSSESSVVHILGPEKPFEDTVETITIRFTEGQARWELNWDVLSSFHDGPDTGFAKAIRYGGSGMTILVSLFLGLMISRNTQISLVVEKRTNELQDEKERLRLALKGGDLGSWDVNLRTGETLFNARWADALGYTIEEVRNARDLWRETIHPEDRDHVHDIGQKYRAGQIDAYEIEYRIKTKDDQVRWVQTKGEAVEFDQDGMAIRMVGTMSDITGRKEIEQELEYQREQLRALTDNIPHYICMSDVNGRFQFINKSFEEWNGVKRDDVIGNTVYDIYPPERARLIRQRDLRAIQSGEIQVEEIEYLYPDGIERSVIMTRFPIKDSTGTVIGLGSIYLDLTERKQMEAALKEAKAGAELANQAKSDFLASMSHELRTPLNAILGFSQLMEYNPAEPLTETQKENVGYIQSGGQHLLSLINDILDLAKIEAGKADLVIEDISVLNIVDECQALISTQAEKKGIEVQINPEHAGSASVRADHVRLNQVLLNLLSNAVKYNRDNGRITVTFEQNTVDCLRINVTDTGDGIPDDKAGELFKPFSRLGAENTDIEGTGIGLVVTKELVERMGGKIGFKSTIGVGTTFWVELPLADTKRKETTVEKDSDKGPDTKRLNGISGKLLYVEDDVLHAKLLEALVCSASDIDVTIASDGQSALDVVGNLVPDIIFVDIKLPDMSGYDVVKKLRKMEKIRNIPIYALTVAATEADMQKGLESGFNDYLTKPLQFEEVTDAILKVL